MTVNPVAPAMPAALFPGTGPILLLGPFTVEWDAHPVAIGHHLVLRPSHQPGDGPDVTWDDGSHVHTLAGDFLTSVRVVGDTLVIPQPDGRQVTIRPVQLADRDLVIQRGQPVQTVHGLVQACRKAWGLG